MDQILHAHLTPFKGNDCINNLDCNIVFDLTGNFSPISIKDQVIRASLIIERAIERNLLTTATIHQKSYRPLLVIGGGIAGIIACYHADRRGIPSFLVEKKYAPLAKYASYGNRLVIPNQYDWPFPHWEKEEFPFVPGDDICVRLKEFKMGAQIESFSQYLKKLEASPLNTLYPHNEVTSIAPEPSKDDKNPVAVARISLKSDVNAEPPPFGMVLICTGFGQEKTFIEKEVIKDAPKKKIYMGVPFWNLDAQKINKIRVPGAARNVLICGGGDGGLQDFLLLVTGENSVKGIYEKLPNHLLKPHERILADAENFAQRSELWLGNRNDDIRDAKKFLGHRTHATYHELHTTYQEVVDKLISVPSEWAEIKTALSPMVDPFFDSFGNRITIAYPCDHFSKCYAFNRFLTLLVVAYMKERGWGEVLLPQTAITDIIPISPHVCETHIYNATGSGATSYSQKVRAATKCFLQKHLVKYKNLSCTQEGTEEEYLSNNPFNPVIVRFGIDSLRPDFSKLNKPYYTAQILPYAIPSKK